MWSSDVRNLALVVIVAAAGLIGCPPEIEPEDDGGDGWTDEQADAGPPSCPDLPSEADASSGSGLVMGQSSDDLESFTPYAEREAEVKLIQGFQGGYHVEPALFLPDPPGGEFQADVHYEVRRTGSDEQLNQISQYPADHHAWMDYCDGLLHHSSRVILSIDSPGALIGDEISLEVRVDIDGEGEVSASKTATVVDGGRP